MQLPEEIMPVVEILRRDVPKPDKNELEALEENIQCRWPSIRCPMGLHPFALESEPLTFLEFCGGLDTNKLYEAVNNFAEWWDELSLPEAREAVDLIWPEEE